MYTNFEQSLIGNVDLGLDGANVRLQTAKAFNLALARGRFGQLCAKILRKQTHLQTLPSQPVSQRRPTSRVVAVPIRQIKGSLGRSTDFDANFNPLQERSRSRWISIATAIQRNIPLPPIELVQVGEAYYVQDGHHRISVAKAIGQDMIDARIVN
jgi:hypothetical protein